MDQRRQVIDATKIKHVTITAGFIDTISGFIDPKTHLNLDFPDHRVTLCVISEKLESGGRILQDPQGLVMAKVKQSSYSHLGKVDYMQRLEDMKSAIDNMHKEKESDDH